MNIDQIISSALTGQRSSGPRWSVSGTDRHGEAFTIDSYRTRHDAADYADECNAAGGCVTVKRVS